MSARKPREIGLVNMIDKSDLYINRVWRSDSSNIAPSRKPMTRHTIENPLVRVLAKMEHVGVGVDAETLRGINARLTAEVESLAAELRRVADRPDLNLNSPTQLRALHFDERGLSPQGVKKLNQRALATLRTVLIGITAPAGEAV